MSERVVTITVELTPVQAAALLRYCDKSTYDMACAVLYAHKPKDLREEQASEILDGLRQVERALQEAKVRSWPWVETGQV